MVCITLACVAMETFFNFKTHRGDTKQLSCTRLKIKFFEVFMVLAFITTFSKVIGCILNIKAQVAAHEVVVFR